MSPPAAAPPTVRGTLAALWGVLGVAWLLGSAVLRLAPKAAAALEAPLSPLQWAFGIGFGLFMAYAEGYRGFQRAFSPRVVARARWLRRHPRPLPALLAPLFCMGLFHATPKRLRVSWGITLMVVGLIAGVRHLPAPWRGLVDAGVVVGLSWGTAAILGWGLVALTGGALPVAPDVPGD